MVSITTPTLPTAESRADASASDEGIACPDRPSTAPAASIILHDATARLTHVELDDLRQHIAHLAEHLDLSGEVRVRVAHDDEIARAHLQFLNVPGTTDVITFDLAEGRSAAGQPLDCDLLICLDEAQRQARSRGIPVVRELLLYILHGVLHCLGEDDHEEVAHARMHAREDAILESLGIGATFAAAASIVDPAETSQA